MLQSHFPICILVITFVPPALYLPSSFTSKPVKMLFSFPVGLLPTNNLKKYITLPPDYRTYATVKGLGYVLEVE